MKLVLLPGLDGTGQLFLPLLSCIKVFQTQIIKYSQSGDQGYEELTEFVKHQLPKEDFILIAESFSGPIAAMLAKENLSHMRGVIFVATFLSPPKKSTLFWAQKLPLKFFLNVPFSKYFMRTLFFGREASDKIVELFIEAVRSMPSSIIKDRISLIRSLEIEKFKTEMPAIYMQALSDKLVPESKGIEFKHYFPNIEFKKVDAAHFLLQVKPTEAAKIIDDFTNSLVR